MKIRDTLQRDPAVHPLVNHGQARISASRDDRVLQELRGELSTFVCEGQYADGIQRILTSYLAGLGQTSQKAAWISGFYGSGKSHLLKMVAHLWEDTRFPDGTTARGLVPSLPEEIQHLLKELDTAGRRGGGLFAATGALPSGSTDHVRLTVLGVLFRAASLPEQYPLARFCLWLQDQGWLESVRSAVERAGKSWPAELNNLYVSNVIARALMDCDARYASEAEARKSLREQFPQRTADVSSAEFLETARRVLVGRGHGGKLPCTVLILDEVQQYIGESSDRSTLVTEVAEAVSKQLDSHVLVVGAGQSALTETPRLQKLMDRFTIPVALSDADVETVTRRVLLQKKPSALSAVHQTLDTHAGEVSRQLQGTRVGEVAEDERVIVDDYPLLPVRRRFWEHCFRQIDAPGTHSQLRSQLRIIHDAVAKLSDRPLGAVVPADELFEAQAPEMVSMGVLLREINERILNLAKDGTEEGRLARRICGLVFLIGKLPREAGADLGIRATKEHVADLLVDDLQADNGKLRHAVGALLEKLAADGTLMELGGEYRLQTREGSEWDREFRNRRTKLEADESTLYTRRDAVLYDEVSRAVRALRVVQGAAKESRDVALHREQTPPAVTGDSVPVWIRDEWSCSEKEVREAARAGGSDGPVVYVFIRRRHDEALRRCLLDTEAAERTLNARGYPSTHEGDEARRSMEGRRNAALRDRDALVREIVAEARVYQGGGSERLEAGLSERLREAVDASLVRLFPRFKEADSAAWPAVIKRVREGSDQPFQPLGFGAATEQHPVSQQVLSVVGAGKTGAEIRKALRVSPFGWPQDAIDAALMALHRGQQLTATLNGAAVVPGQLDQNKISKAEFRREHAVISHTDRIKVRGLFARVGVDCRTEELAAKTPEFLRTVTALAQATGGPPPLPAAPSVADLEEIGRRVGNDQLAALRDAAPELEKRIDQWKKAKAAVEQRLPSWGVAEGLARHAAGLEAAAEAMAQMEAIRTGRLLLEPVDPVTPVRVGLADVLRSALGKARKQYEGAHAAALATLADNADWQRLSETDRGAVLDEAGLVLIPAPDVATDEALVKSLDGRSLAGWETEERAVAGSLGFALELGAKRLEPKVRTVAIERVTLRTEEDVKRWAERQQTILLDAVKHGPVLLS